MEWDDYFLALCETVALKSKDRSTQLGAVIVGPGHEIRSTGYNGFPRGVNDGIDDRHQRPIKYKWTEHAERNAIYNAARCGVGVLGCTMYCGWLPCTDCARGIIGAGITRICVGTAEMPGRWANDMRVASMMLDEARVLIRCGGAYVPWKTLL